MRLKSLLHEKKAAIVSRWQEYTLSTYASETSAFFHRTKDRFANPVGHALRVGTAAIFDSVLDGMDPEKICRDLTDIIKIRAVQDFSPSEAVSFVFLLKKAVRGELGEEAGAPGLSAELAEFDAEVDQIALFAFDIFVRCREQVYALRVNEANRSVAGVMKRLDRVAGDER